MYLFLLCIKLINEYIFKLKCNCQRKSMQEKESIMVVWCKLKVPSLRITVRHRSASLAMLNSYNRDRIFNLQLTTIKNSNNKENNVRTFVTHEYEIFFCPYVCYIRKCNMAEPMLHTKIWYLSVSALFFNIWKCVMSFSVLLFSEFGQMHIKMFQKLRGSDSLVFKIWTSA